MPTTSTTRGSRMKLPRFEQQLYLGMLILYSSRALFLRVTRTVDINKLCSEESARLYLRTPCDIMFVSITSEKTNDLFNFQRYRYLFS